MKFLLPFVLLACSEPKECLRWKQVPVPTETKWCTPWQGSKAYTKTTITEHLEYRCAEYKEPIK